jgi:predicted nucleic acid-binding protein
MADWRRQYWDSVLFCVYVTNTDADKVKTINDLLTAYDREAIEIITSTFAVAEVRRVPVLRARTPPDESQIKTQPVDEAQRARVRRMFESDQLDMRAVTPRVADKAADIGNTYPRLLPADCVHIATAIDAGADVLVTWDGSGQRRRPGTMLRYDGRIDGLAIKEPFVPMGEMFDPPRA